MPPLLIPRKEHAGDEKSAAGQADAFVRALQVLSL
jgi:hypothetical protein